MVIRFIGRETGWTGLTGLIRMRPVYNIAFEFSECFGLSEAPAPARPV
jgi:hypothetical protein